MRQPVSFIGAAYQARSVNVNAQRCINLYPEVDPQDGKSVMALYRTPGLRLHCTVDGVNRGQGMYVTSTGRWFAVASNKLYEVYPNQTFVERGTLLTTSGPVFIDDNGATSSIGGDQMIITDGTYGYIFNFTTNALTQISHPDFPGGGPCCFQDQYFLVVKPGTREVFASALLDGLIWDATVFGVKEGIADPIVGIHSNGQDFWVYGSQSTEIWYNAGLFPFPFTRRLGTVNKIGLAAKASVIDMKDSFFWIGDGEQGRGQVFMSQGYTPTRISTHPIENFLADQTVLNDAVAWQYEREGHYYYVISMQTADKTFVYDMTTGLWHERAYLEPLTGFFGRHRAISCVFLKGIHYCADYQNGNIYVLDPDEGTDNGNPLKWLRSSPHLSENEDRIFCDEFQVVIQSGVGNSNDPGKDPKAFLRISKDGGNEFGNAREGIMGKIGEYKTRCRWLRNGVARDFVFEVSGTSPVKTVLIKGVGRFRAGVN